MAELGTKKKAVLRKILVEAEGAAHRCSLHGSFNLYGWMNICKLKSCGEAKKDMLRRS